MKASSFFGKNTGNNKCYYCGASCDDTYKSQDFVKDTFTNRDIVFYPGSKFVCLGCVESLGRGPDQLKLIDGTIKQRENERGMQPRMYSWILTEKEKLAGTKAHIYLFREAILNPPEPPFSIVLSDTGQKQILFRSPIALDRQVFQIALEDEIILVNLSVFPDFLKKATKLSAAIGKVALLEPITTQMTIAVEKYYSDLSVLEEWSEIKNEPMAKLAAWVCKNKEDASNEYPSFERGSVSATAGGPRRPEQEITLGGRGNNKGRDNQISLFSSDSF